ncbi:MAG: recombinase family protein, partial [Bacteroidetes bacterium]|nr:recombinase family protein [Bacteroidota bacterium]
MSRKAILYTRVSTDEQATRGYSLSDQHEKLKAYCMIHRIDAVGHFQDDHSAKSFERPAFRQLIEFLRQNKHAADLLLFIKWDRFSRNATESYEMLRTLKRYNVEAQATEQPLDLSIPESKLMLALFLASPEVENDRRSLNTSMGMRRALKEGRWVVSVPMGYERKRDEHNKPIIIPGKDAKFIHEAFVLLATGEYSQDYVRKKLNSEGFKCSKSNFSNFLRNPVYIGKIKIKASKEEEETIVNGLHEPIVDEATFSIVQDILDGRRVKNNVAKIHSAKPELPLRGFLECPRCGSRLTGSASKGHGGRYFYYHCGKGCKERFRATVANEKFIELLEEIQPDHNAIDLYDAILKELLSENENRRKETSKTTEVEIRKVQERINSLQDKLADNQINISDYNSGKQRYDTQLRELTEKKANQVQLSRDIYQQLVFSFSFLKDLPSKYRDTSINGQQQIIGSIFPGKLVFQENRVRTSRINEVVKLFATIGNPSGRNKKG